MSVDPNFPFNFKEGAVLLIDKPLTWTSFDVVNKVRYNIGKAKVGHAGTLDPLATGLLILCTGKFTKKLNEFQGLDKTYEGTFYIGATRPSYDRETEIDQEFETTHITEELIQETIKQFMGDIEQMPPMFSAIKKDGQKLYNLARKGKTVKVEPRQVRISEFEITEVALPYVKFKVTCSKGTYIRSLAFDLGKALNSGGHLHDLQRTAIGDKHLKDAWNLDEFIAYVNDNKALFLPDASAPKSQ